MQRHGLFASVVVHVAVILIALFGLPLPKFPDEFEPDAISLELISESDLQQLRQGQTDGTPEEQKQPPPPPRQAQTPPPPPPPPAPAPQTQMTPPPEPPPPPRAPEPPKLAQLPPAARQPAPPQPTPQPTDEEDEREAVEWTPPKAPTRRPEPPKPQVAQVPPKPEPPKPEPPKPEPPKPEPPKPQPPKPEPPKPQPPKPEPAKPDPLANVLKNVQQLAQQPPKPAPQTPAQPAPQQTAQAQTRAPAPPSAATAPAQRGAPNSMAATGQLTAKEADALREHIRPCWNVDLGARDAQSLVVVIHAKIGTQGNVVSTEVTDRARYASDPAFRQAADRAMRALNNPRCNLLPLEPARAAQAMQEGFEFRFDPRDMF